MNNYKQMMEELKRKMEGRNLRLENAINRLDEYSDDIGLVLDSLGDFVLECKPKDEKTNVMSFRYEFDSNKHYKMQMHCKYPSLVSIIGSVGYADRNHGYVPCMSELEIDDYFCVTERTGDFILGLELLVDNMEELLSPMIKKALEK